MTQAFRGALELPQDSHSALRSDLRIVRSRYGALRNWPLIRGHFVNRLALLREAATA